MTRPAALLSLLLAALPAAAQTSFPMVTHALPLAAQRGKTSEVAVDCRTSSLAGAYKVLVSGDGVAMEPVPPKDAKPVDPKAAVPVVASLKLKVTVAADAPLGVREFRVACPHGISSLGQLLVVDDPVVAEAAGNATAAKAQAVPVPAVVCGRIEAAENVDYYKFAAKGGQVLTFEVFCARLQDKIHDLQKHADPLIAVYDAAGRELAAADDGYFADPWLSFPVPKDGEYVVAVRDATYAGDPRWSYALTITDKPYVAQVFPLGVNPNSVTAVEPVGSAKVLQPKWDLKAPGAPGVHTVTLPHAGGQTNPTAVVVSPLPMIAEQEPNDTLKEANRITLPCGVNGRIGARRDLDYFVFKGTKGKAVRFEVFARRFGTPLQSQVDASLDLMTADGKPVATNDDTNGKDPLLVFTPPADADYVLRVRDLNNKGGEGFVYFLEAAWDRPDFTLKCDPSKAMIAPGSRTAWFAQVTRRPGFTGAVKIEVKGLPAGVTVNPLTIPEAMTQGLLVVSAEKGAKADASMVKVIGTAEAKDEAGKPVTLVREATPVEEIYFPGGGRGRFDVGMQAVAVADTSDVAEVVVKPNRIVLKPGQEVKIDVEVKRGPRYTGAVTLDVLLRHLGGVFGNPLPPGVTMVDGKSRTSVAATATAGHITLKAAPDAAECTDVPLCVQGFVSINFVVKLGYASEPILLTVKK